MKTVTYEEFLEFDPYWWGCGEQIKACFDRFGGSMSALDILNLDDVGAEDRLWAVLREELIPVPILHEFGCVCAEYALSLIDNPDPRSLKAVEVKRAWLRGEATDKELDAASDDAWDAWGVARAGTTRVAWEATRAAWEAARDDAWAASWHPSETAARAGKAAGAARDAVCEALAAYLIMTLEEEK